MAEIALTIVPVFFMIFLGFGLRAGRLLAEGFWEPAERLTYYLLFPALLVKTLATTSVGDLGVVPMAAALIVVILAMALAVLPLRRPLGLDGPGLTSLFQGTIRFNTYIGLAVAFGIAGDPGVAASAVAVAVLAPLVNVLSVLVLARYGRGANPSASGIAGQIVRNPLILACVLGIALNASGLGLPGPVASILEILARAALPLGLLAVGAGLDLKGVRVGGATVAVAAGLKLLAVPALLAWVCQAFGVTGTAAFAAILFGATPSAPSAYILARQLGGDARLMASILTVQTLLAIVTLPLVLGLLART